LWKVAAASRAAAAAWLAGLEADLGGTEMEAALLSTFALAQTVRSDVLLITDGEIEAIDGAIDAAVAAGHRVFIVGIGASPAETHLRRLAEATGGACDFVAPGEAVGPAVLRMFARLRTSRLATCRIEWPAGTDVAWMTPLPTGVFDGDTVIVHAQLRQWTDGEVRLVGRRAQGETDEPVAGAAIGASDAEAGDLARMVGAARVRQLLATSDAAARTEAQNLAVAYQLVSPQTNFLLVHQRAEADRAKDMPELHAVRPMLAAGWGGVGTVSAAPAPMMMCFDALDTPAVMRQGKRSNKIRASVRAPASGDDSGILYSLRRVMEREHDYEDGEIPAFLRKVEAEEASSRLRAAPYWSDGPDYRGFTPVGVCAYLDETPPAAHPCTYGNLLAVGVAACVVDWLRQTFHEHNGAPVSEADVVAAFIYLMMSDEMLRQLGLPSGVRAAIGVATRRAKAALKGASKRTSPPRLTTLVEEMQRALNGISAEHWPEAIEPAIG
jgi:Ca-activated chloride channel family protein